MSDISAEIAKVQTKLELIINEQAVIRAELKALSNQLVVTDNTLGLSIATVRTAISDIAVTTGGGKRAIKTTAPAEEGVAATTAAAGPLAKGYPANRMLWFKTEFASNEAFKEDIIKRLNEALKEDVMVKAAADPSVTKKVDSAKPAAIVLVIWGYIRENGTKAGQSCTAIYNDIDKMYNDGKKAFEASAKTGSVEQTIDTGTPK